MGVFEELHEFEHAKDFADALTEATQTHYGHVGPAWISYLIANNYETAAQHL